MREIIFNFLSDFNANVFDITWEHPRALCDLVWDEIEESREYEGSFIREWCKEWLEYNPKTRAY